MFIFYNANIAKEHLFGTVVPFNGNGGFTYEHGKAYTVYETGSLEV